MDELKELYAQYGALMVQKEIVDGQVNAVRGKIVEALNAKQKAQETPVALTPPPADAENIEV